MADSPGSISEYLRALKASPVLGRQVVQWFTQQAKGPEFAMVSPPFPEPLQKALKGLGIHKLFSHQAEAIEAIRSHRDVVVATPTSSGKTMVYNLPMAEMVLHQPESRGLYLFPLKALAQDQLRTLEDLSGLLSRCGATHLPGAAIYDGDTTPYRRARIRELPPNCLLTNPEMLHLSLLPYHDRWAEFWRNLSMVVVDEIHTYRGVLGSNMAWVFRRLSRICRRYGSDPVFVTCSATIGNPGELASELTARPMQEIVKSGAPSAERHMILMEPGEAGPAATAVQLLLAAIHRGLRTIVYTQSRKLTELVSLWASQRAGRLKERISAYRAGYLPEERREIEHKLASGSVLAVISTSALELGIDIGELDLCILVGYPGTLMSLRQRSGRVGRALRDSAVIMVAGEDALDQYFLQNPVELMKNPPENAVINVENPVVASGHLVSAAAEEPIALWELEGFPNRVAAIAKELVEKGLLFQSVDTGCLYSPRKYPQRDISLRGTGRSFRIVLEGRGENIGSIDGYRVWKETHPGAVYLHRGDTYLVKRVDSEARRVLVEKKQVNYFTRPRSVKETEILKVDNRTDLGALEIFAGDLRVTEKVTGYDVRMVRGQRLVNRVDLDLPPMIFETRGFWFHIPQEIKRRIEREQLHFMGGIHALEHAVIGMMPLVVLCDRNDLGGISITFHPQIQGAAVFVYDGIPGGAGLADQAFHSSERLLSVTHDTIRRCRCELGCPSCVHSPKCGSGNRPIHKQAALRILELVHDRGVVHGGRRGVVLFDSTGNSINHNEKQSQNAAEPESFFNGRTDKRIVPAVRREKIRYGVFDLETRLSAQEVGGWHRADRMGVSCAVLYDSGTRALLSFQQDQLPHLFKILRRMDLVIGFNIKRFDFLVLSPYASFDLYALPVLDILEEVHQRLGYRLSLDSLARASMGTRKTANGLMALKWWKQGKIEKIIRYCKDDVRITRDLYLMGRKQGYLLFRNREKALVKLPVHW